MKYRNDFVTNSSSSVSLWRDFSLKLISDDWKLKYDKKITVYTGYPCDFVKKKFDLQTAIENGGLPIAWLRFTFDDRNSPLYWERFALADIFMQYCAEVDCNAMFDVKKSKICGKLYLTASFKGNDGTRDFCFDMDNYCYDMEKWIYVKGCDNDNMTFAEWWEKLSESEKACPSMDKLPDGHECRNYHDNYCHHSGMGDSISHARELDNLRQAGFDADYYIFTMKFSEFLYRMTEEYYSFPIPFHLWLAEKHGVRAALALKSEGICHPDETLGDTFATKIHGYTDCDTKRILIEKTVGNEERAK